MGTFGYIAPEVFTGGPIDERADTFANSEYHLPGESIEIRALDAVVQRCLAKDPRDRYGSATEVAKELVPTLARCEGFVVRHGVTISDPALG